jgi:hypothetical protein
MPETGFLPSRDGLAFINNWPKHSDVVVKIPVVGDVVIGDASRGLCGGMVFTALDGFTAKLPPPSAPQPPPGTPLFDYIVRRLIASWHVPEGIAKYLQWMNTTTHTSRFMEITGHHGVASWTVKDEWQKVKADLDAGQPSPLGLVTVESNDPRRLSDNHQVLAYGYELDGAKVTIKVYDPNTDRTVGDGLQMTAMLDDPDQSAHIVHNIAIDHDVRGFFHVGYEPAIPPS